MAILDQWGNPMQNTKFAAAASRNPFRGVQYNNTDRSINELIPSQDRRALASLSRRLVFNQGPPKEAIRQKASYSVGQAWMPIYSGSDSAVGEQAASWLQNVWFPICDVRGNGHDWREFLEIVSKCMDRDGESFVLLTKARGGFPRIQHIPSHQVWSKSTEKKVGSGRYRGLKIYDGVICNKQGASVAYRVNADSKGNDFRDISARDLIHVYDSDFPEQRRGFPAFSHALEDMKNSMTSTQLETIRQNIISSLYLVEKSSKGPDLNDPAWIGEVDTTNKEAVMYEQIAPGIRHISGDQDIEVIKHENPSDTWSRFNDRLLKMATVGIGWSYSMIWASPGQGTAERAEIMRARKAIEARQKRLLYMAKRVVTYAIAKASEGDLGVEAPGNMLKWSFSYPERLSVDDGREARALREAVEKGLCSEQAYQAFKGKEYEEHLREQAMAKVARTKVAREVSETNAEGVQVSPTELGLHDLLRVPAGDELVEESDPLETIEPETDQGDEPADPDEAAPPARQTSPGNAKEIIDAYGAAVRAGALTPQPKDENHFRALAGLPQISEAASELWRKQGGTRQPVTLAKPEAPAKPEEEQ